MCGREVFVRGLKLAQFVNDILQLRLRGVFQILKNGDVNVRGFEVVKVKLCQVLVHLLAAIVYGLFLGECVKRCILAYLIYVLLRFNLNLSAFGERFGKILDIVFGAFLGVLLFHLRKSFLSILNGLILLLGAFFATDLCFQVCDLLAHIFKRSGFATQRIYNVNVHTKVGKGL